MKKTFFWNDIEFVVNGRPSKYWVEVKLLHDKGIKGQLVSKEWKNTIKEAKEEAIGKLELHGIETTKRCIWAAILD